jgi:hypothetical protein
MALKKATIKQWINVGKLLAIMAVLVDHTNGFLYTNPLIAKSSYFSVSLFVLLGGVTSYYSCKHHNNEFNAREMFRRLKTILLPYAIATAVYQIFQYHIFDLPTYLRLLISFSASPPFYFVLFYIQLIIIAPFLYCMICKAAQGPHKQIMYGALIILCIAFASVCINFTYVLGVHGGGQFLFGGTYIILFLMGMLFANESIEATNKVRLIIFAGIFSILIIVWLACSAFWGSLDAVFAQYFGPGFNPPSLSFILYAVLVFGLVFTFISFLETFKNGLMARILNVFSKLGSYSLYIFLYHLLVKMAIDSLVLKGILSAIITNDVLLRRLVYYPAMLLVPCFLAILIKKGAQYISKVKEDACAN